MAAKKDKKIAMSGASGFVGRNLQNSFDELGWETVPLSRQDFEGPAAGLSEKLAGVDAIVNLAGAPIIKRWSTEYKKTLYSSRVDLTEKLAAACLGLTQKPAVFVSASAVGYYAANGSHTEEKCRSADNFLGALSRDWEAAAGLVEKDLRLVIFRFGVVLGKDGGALARMMPVFRAGLGGPIGSGAQAVSWIHMTDLIQAFVSAITDPKMSGIYNLTAPEPTTNNGLTRALGRALRRPTFFRVPELVLRLVFGEGAQVLTSGQAVIPERLLDQGFKFLYTDIDTAVRDCVD